MLLENLINGQLAQLLIEYDLDAVPELRRAGKRPDVLISFDNAAVTIEAEIDRDSGARSRVVREAESRLEQGLSTVSIALLYNVSTADQDISGLMDSLRESVFRWRVMPSDGGWHEGGIDQLVAVIKQSPHSAEINVNFVAKQLSDGLDVAVNMLGVGTHRVLAERLNLPRDDGSKGKRVATFKVAAKRGMLALATAIMFHSRLDLTFQSRCPDGWDGDWPPETAAASVQSPTALTDFSRAWNLILAIDYKPIFVTAQSILTVLGHDPNTVRAVRNVGEAALKVMQHVGIARHDVLGRIFHRVLETARYDGSFYTSTSGAVLLANLALDDDFCDWSDDDLVSDLRIIDPACGTGTLLMAAAERIRDLRLSSDGHHRDAELERVISLTIVEDMLYGYDTNLTAVHLAATTLGMLSPSTEFRSMNIHQARLDVINGSAYLGSLEFLRGQARLASWPSPSRHVEPDRRQEEDEDITPPAMDLVIMNPPFTRDSLRYHQFESSHKLSLKRSEMALLDQLSDLERQAARRSGIANAFMVLSKHLLKSESGVLACVLPTTIATNPAAFYTRKFLAKKFHVRYVVVPHVVDRCSFSENTGISDMLLVAQAKNESNASAPTRVVKLRFNPNTPADAISLASNIARGALGDDGVVAEVESARMLEGDWGAVQFLSQHLVDEFDELRDGRMFNAVNASELFDVGPAGQRIRDAFRRVDTAPSPRREALWDHKGDIQRTMNSVPDNFIVSKDTKESLADRYWERRSHLLLPNRLALPNARVSSVFSETRVVGSAWSPCNSKDADWDVSYLKATCLYLNSSLGILSLLGIRSMKFLTYPPFSLDGLRRMPLPDWRDGELALGVYRMSAEFDLLCSEEFLPLSDIGSCLTRRKVDEVVADCLKVDLERVELIRRSLSEEPCVLG